MSKKYEERSLISFQKAMADRDAMYSLAGLVEMDDFFFGSVGEVQGRVTVLFMSYINKYTIKPAKKIISVSSQKTLFILYKHN